MGAIKGLRSQYLMAVLSVCALLAAGLGCKVKPDAQWKQELAGKKLSRASNSGAMSNKTDIFFCSDGEYGLRTQFSGFSTGGAGTLSMANENVELGRWTVENSTLVLRSQKGDERRFDMFQGMDDEVIELNGAGFLVTEQNECES